jgi:hypothetical protein
LKTPAPIRYRAELPPEIRLAVHRLFERAQTDMEFICTSSLHRSDEHRHSRYDRRILDFGDHGTGTKSPPIDRDARKAATHRVLGVDMPMARGRAPFGTRSTHPTISNTTRRRPLIALFRAHAAYNCGRADRLEKVGIFRHIPPQPIHKSAGA